MRKGLVLVFLVLFLVIVGVTPSPAVSQDNGIPGYREVTLQEGLFSYTIPEDWYLLRVSDYQSWEEFVLACRELVKNLIPQVGDLRSWSPLPDTIAFGMPHRNPYGGVILLTVHYDTHTDGLYSDFTENSDRSRVGIVVAGGNSLELWQYGDSIIARRAGNTYQTYVSLTLPKTAYLKDVHKDTATMTLFGTIKPYLRDDAGVVLLSLREINEPIDVEAISEVLSMPLTGMPELP